MREMEREALNEEGKGKLLTHPRGAVVKKYGAATPSQLGLTNQILRQRDPIDR